MKISNVSAFALRFTDSDEAVSPYHLPREGWRPVSPGAHETMVVRIETDEGIFGYGEGQIPVSPDTTKTIVDDLCTPFLLGKDPFDVEFLWQRLYSAMREHIRPGSTWMRLLPVILPFGIFSEKQQESQSTGYWVAGTETVSDYTLE